MPRFLLKARKLADRRTFQGLEISVETAAGQHRHWHDPHTGRGGSTEMLHDYGYIRGSQGADGDHVDCYVGPHADATHAYVVDQRKAPHFQELDEQKVMLGFLDPEEARDAYLRHYDDPRFFGGLRAVPMADFKRQVLATCSSQPLVMSVQRGDLAKSRMADNGFSVEEATRIAKDLGIDFATEKFDAATLAHGMNVELEHSDVTKKDARKTAMIAHAHLRERANYYQLLDKYVEKSWPRLMFKGAYSYHKYKRRWRGPDGKWQYEYGEDVQVPLHRKPDVPDGYDDLHGSKPIKRGMNLAQVEDAIRNEPLEHVCIFGVDGEQLSRIRGSKSDVPFSDKTVSLIRDRGNDVITHNHPSGGCFSRQDLWTAISINVAEIRAVTPVGTFSFKRPVDGWFGNGTSVDKVDEALGKSRFAHIPTPKPHEPPLPESRTNGSVIKRMLDFAVSSDREASKRQDRWMVESGKAPGAPKEPDELAAWEKHSREARYEEINRTFANANDFNLSDEVRRWKVEFEPKGNATKRQGDAAIWNRIGQRSATAIRPKTVARAPEQLALFRSHRMVFRVGSPLLKGSGHKYIKRESTGDPKRPWRYYYAESSVARDVHEGSHVRLGDQVAEVVSVAAGGKIVLKLGGEVLAVTPKQWSDLLSKHYGEKYLGWAEKRAAQSVNAVLRHVPRQLLTDLEGTDAQRLAQLKVRAPEVYAKLQASFARSGVSPFRAKQVLSTVLSRRGWKPEARAAVIGLVLENKDKGYRQVISGAENLAGGAQVEVAHVAAVTELRNPAGQSFSASVAQVGKQAEAELAALSAALSKARNGKPADLAAVLTTALSSKSMAKLGLLVKAFPGIKDKVVEPARKALLAVPAAAPRPAPTRDGARGVVYIADENGAPKPLDIQYKLVEAGEAIASHKPDTFAKRSDYPEGIQERAYHRDKAEQAKVMRNAQKMNPAFVVNTNPDAVNGPPIMDSNGVVLGGNSRTMSLQRAYLEHPEQATAMKQYLADHAHEVGLRSSDVNAMKNPILVRVMAPKSTEEQKLLVRQMNESFTQGMDPRTMQVALGRKLDDAALESLGADMEPGETLNAFLATSRADGFVNSLMRAGVIDQRNASQYLMKGTRTLNEDGRTMVSRILVGRMVGDADLLSNTGSRMIENIARSVPLMAQARQYGDGYDMSSDLRVALEAYNGLQYRVSQGHRDPLSPTMTDREFQGLFRQTELFGGGDENPVTKNPRAHALLEVLIRQNGPAKMASVFTRYAEQAKANPEGQGGLFGASKSPTEIFQEVIAPPKSAGPAPKFYPKPVAA